MKLNVAVAQFAPAVLDLKRCVDKACTIIEDAGKKKVRLLAFPETWIPVAHCGVDAASNQSNARSGRNLHARRWGS